MTSINGASRRAERPFHSLGSKIGILTALVTLLTMPITDLAAATLAQPAAAAGRTIVTPAGRMRGIMSGGVYQFRGIAFARPPVGELRWRPPQPPPASAHILDATKFGAACPQITGLGFFAGPPSSNEDCLYLNVFTTDLKPKAKAPVLVWLHGGGFVAGDGSGYDGSRLARGGPAGPTIVVTINHRLGLFGWLSHPALDAEGHPFGNYGLMDQQAALRWVKQNIAAFGGDPDRVTLAGQSAGGLGVQAHLVAPDSKGLFHRAIIQSEPFPVTIPLSFGTKLGRDLAKAAGCPSSAEAEAASCLRRLTAPQLLTLQGSFVKNGPYVAPVGVIVDGTVIPAHIETAYRNGTFAHVPVMNGVTRDEAAFEESTKELFGAPLTAADYKKNVEGTFARGSIFGLPSFSADAAGKLLARYPVGAYASPALASVALNSDRYLCEAMRLNRLLAPRVPLWTYVFAYRDAPWYMPKQSFPHGAAHTIDLQFLFPGWHGGPMGLRHELDAEGTKLSDRLVAAWTNFMYFGDPNGPGQDSWPRYTPGRASYLVQTVPNMGVIDEAAHARAHHCELWSSISREVSGTSN